jgi:citrate lyase synthetase
MAEVKIDLIAVEKAVQEADNWFKQKIFGDVVEEFYQRGSFSVYIIHASADGRLYEGVGFSKARQEISAARYDSERGRNVSKGRAIHDLFGSYKREKK